VHSYMQRGGERREKEEQRLKRGGFERGSLDKKRKRDSAPKMTEVKLRKKHRQTGNQIFFGREKGGRGMGVFLSCH